MLTPDTRVLLTDALRPPAGLSVDAAIATTFSLDLTALLLAPVTFAMLDTSAQVDGDDLAATDPIGLLEAVQRYSELTTVFCQAGGISVPASYRSVLTFVEGAVHPVMAPAPGRLFHPKSWTLRFVDDDGAYRHRFVVLSRNLTFDLSWDTVLVLDEDELVAEPVDPGPISAFLRALPPLATSPLPDYRAAQVESVAATIADARFAPPAPFRNAEVLPLGLDGVTVPWPFPDAADRVLAMSPFLDAGLLRRLPDANDRTLVSRAETFDRLGTIPLDRWATRTLSSAAERDPSSDENDASPGDPRSTAGPVRETDRVRDGLHAKTVVVDSGRDSTTVTGSANLTTAAWGGNVELAVALHGRTADVGVRTTLDGTKDVPGLEKVLAAFAPRSPEPVVDPAESTVLDIDDFHRRLAASGLRATLAVDVDDSDRGGGDPTARLVVGTQGLPDPVLGATTVAWPVTVPSDLHARGLHEGSDVAWDSLSLRAVTPFLAVETTAGTGDARATRRCVLVLRLDGDVAERRHAAVRDALRSRDDVARYLALLLADPAAASVFAASPAGDSTGASWAMSGSTTPDLFEPLVRAVAHGDEALDRVAQLVDRLAEMPDGDDLVPEGFAELWTVVEEARRAR
ncbi:phospholipase D family protein [Cellulosimicrobium sp. SJTW-1]|uniref:phospholipase D family protein n=1 Tax=Cellulosimicrobium sp. SJTW-1 TaxID=3078082 RepID=UPI0039EA1A63